MNSSRISTQSDRPYYGDQLMDGTYPTPERLERGITQDQDAVRKMLNFDRATMPERAHHKVLPTMREATPPPETQPRPEELTGWALIKDIWNGLKEEIWGSA